MCSSGVVKQNKLYFTPSFLPSFLYSGWPMYLVTVRPGMQISQKCFWNQTRPTVIVQIIFLPLQISFSVCFAYKLKTVILFVCPHDKYEIMILYILYSSLLLSQMSFGSFYLLVNPLPGIEACYSLMWLQYVMYAHFMCDQWWLQ